MATTLAACELSGYSKSNHTFLWFSLSGSGFSSSLIKPSSSLCVLSKSNWNFISLAFDLFVIVCVYFFWFVWILIDCDWLISIHTNHSSNMKANRSSIQCAPTIHSYAFTWHLLNSDLSKLKHWTRAPIACSTTEIAYSACLIGKHVIFELERKGQCSLLTSLHSGPPGCKCL